MVLAPAIEELGGGEVAKGLMRTDRVPRCSPGLSYPLAYGHQRPRQGDAGAGRSNPDALSGPTPRPGQERKMPLRVLQNVIAVGSVRSASTAPVARVSCGCRFRLSPTLSSPRG